MLFVLSRPPSALPEARRAAAGSGRAELGDEELCPAGRHDRGSTSVLQTGGFRERRRRASCPASWSRNAQVSQV
jgi:hypothetical protein